MVEWFSMEVSPSVKQMRKLPGYWGQVFYIEWLAARHGGMAAGRFPNQLRRCGESS